MILKLKNLKPGSSIHIGWTSGAFPTVEPFIEGNLFIPLHSWTFHEGAESEISLIPHEGGSFVVRVGLIGYKTFEKAIPANTSEDEVIIDVEYESTNYRITDGH